MWSLRIVYVLFFIALFADFFANDKPLYCRYKGETCFPVLHEYAVNLGMADVQKLDWKKIQPESSIWPMVRYAPHDLDFENAQYVSPSARQKIPSPAWKHYMGTDGLGQDVLSGMIHGTRIALSVGIFSMLIASIIGIIMGACAGYFGDRGLQAKRSSVIVGIVFLFLAFFYAFQCRAYILEDAMNESFLLFAAKFIISIFIFCGVMMLGYFISMPLGKFPWMSKKVNLPVDIIISRFIEIFNSVPRLLLIFSIVILIRPSLSLVIAMIGFTSWTEIARFVRAEMLRIRNLEYIESATALGYSKRRIILLHALPNALPPVLISISFGIAGAILTESSLSFLGIGVPIDTLTWGKLLSSAREAPQAWWLAIFPGLAIFITVIAFNLIGEGLANAMDPKEGI